MGWGGWVRVKSTSYIKRWKEGSQSHSSKGHTQGTAILVSETEPRRCRATKPQERPARDREKEREADVGAISKSQDDENLNQQDVSVLSWIFRTKQTCRSRTKSKTSDVRKKKSKYDTDIYGVRTRKERKTRLVGRPRVCGGDVVVEDLAHVADQQAHRQRAAHRALGQLGHLCLNQENRSNTAAGRDRGWGVTDSKDITRAEMSLQAEGDGCKRQTVCREARQASDTPAPPNKLRSQN